MSTEEISNLIKKIYSDEGKYPQIARVSELSGEDVNKIRKIYRHIIRENVVKIDDKLDDKKKEVKLPSKNALVRLIMGFVGVILVVVSIHFTYTFNELAMSRFWALMLSLAMILFTSLAFTIASMTGGKTSIVVYCLWSIGVAYSMFTAVAGQYNDFRKYTSSDKSVSINKQIELTSIQLNDYVKKQNDLLHWRDEERAYTENPDLKTENPSTWKTIQRGVNNLNDVEVKIENARNKLMTLSLENDDSGKTIYHWLSEIIHVPSDLIQFIIIVFPSVFLDLCAGICLKFAFC